MTRAVELTVTVMTDDTSPDAADRIEATARRCLGLWFDPQRITLQQVRKSNRPAWSRHEEQR